MAKQMFFTVPPGLTNDQLKELRKEIYKTISRVHADRKDAVRLLESNPGISLTALQTTLRQMGVQRQKSALRGLADKCGFTYTP